MARIYWDSMLFIYLFQNDPVYGERVAEIRESLVRRGDELCTSHLGLGEVLAGAYRDRSEVEAKAIKQGFADAAVRLLPFDLEAADAFGRIRARHGTSAPDSIHLACASMASVDLFLTGDRKLTRLHIPGIRFITGLETGLL
jgi:uncharacterized protein